jgi:hypothetical protein
MAITVRTGGAGGRIGATLFGLVFAGFGVVFTFALARPLAHQYAPWFWPSAECTILESRFVDGGATTTAAGAPNYRFETRYRYVWQGSTFESTVVRRGYSGGDDAAAAQRLAARYPAGSRQRCYVDPEAPREASLERPRLLALAVILFPLLFVGAGLAMAILPWRGARPSPLTATVATVQPLGRPTSSPTGCLSAFFALFAVFGALFLIPFFGLPLWHVSQARGWDAVPCTIVSSGVESHSGSDGGPTFSVAVTYHYTVAGHEYTGSRYGFMGGSSSGTAGKEAVVARYPPGAQATCWVNPQDATDSVLERGLTNDMWVGLIPMVFVVLGLGGMVGVNVAARRSASAMGVSRWLPGVRAARPSQALGVEGAHELADDPSAPRLLDPKQSPFAKVGCSIVLALLVGGLVGTFLWQVVYVPLRQGAHPEGCVVLFLVPFTLIALGLLVNVPYQMLAFFNPRSRLELQPGVLQPGGTARLRWQFTGIASRLRRVEIKLEGAEEATHRVGTSSRTDRSIFLQMSLLDTADPAQIEAGGEIAVALPANVVHSFSAPHNKITYKLTLRGAIAHWPDVLDEFTVEVAPEKVGA